MDARAWLGDERAGNLLVHKFEECIKNCNIDYHYSEIPRAVNLEKLAHSMARWSSQRALDVYARGLSSSRSFGQKGWRVSVAFCLLKVLQKEHPQDPILQQLDKHLEVTARKFKDEFHQRYLSYLEAHLRDTYQLHVSFQAPFFFEGKKMLPFAILVAT
jgi:hypothetical protein